MAFVVDERAVVVQGGERAVGPVAGALRIAHLAGYCVVGAMQVEVAFQRGGREAAAHTFQQIARDFCDIFGVRVEVKGALRPDAREVRVANHSSYLDILALMAASDGRFLSMQQVKGWPLVGLVARRIGVVFVDRNSTDGRAQGLKALLRAAQEAGPPLIVFPEGRTSKKIRAFARGAFSAARNAGLPVRPIAIVYSDRDQVAWVDNMPLLDHVWRRLCGPEVVCVIHALEPLDSSERGSEELANEAQRMIAREIALREPS